MSVTIAALGWQNNRKPISTILSDQYAWLKAFSVYSGYKGKTVLHDTSLSANILSSYDCTIDVNDVIVDAKDIDISEYNFTIPVPRCDYNETWLSGFAPKGVDVDGIFLEDLQKHVYDKIGKEIRGTVLSNIFAEAALDADVIKIAASPVNTPTNAFTAVSNFVQNLPSALLKEALGEEVSDYQYIIYVSSLAYSMLSIHLSSNGVNETEDIRIGGLLVKPAALLTDEQMGCTFVKNLIVIFDDESDINRFKVVPKDEINTDYIVGGLAVVGTYQHSDKFVLTNNF